MYVWQQHKHHASAYTTKPVLSVTFHICDSVVSVYKVAMHYPLWTEFYGSALLTIFRLSACVAHCRVATREGTKVVAADAVAVVATAKEVVVATAAGAGADV